MLLDEWHATLVTVPEEALVKLNELRQRYRQMLIEHQVNIQDYIELLELTLMSLTTFAPNALKQLTGTASPKEHETRETDVLMP